MMPVTLFISARHILMAMRRDAECAKRGALSLLVPPYTFHRLTPRPEDTTSIVYAAVIFPPSPRHRFRQPRRQIAIRIPLLRKDRAG
jgi:hypothetical protein